jgi:hypothetical protein
MCSRAFFHASVASRRSSSVISAVNVSRSGTVRSIVNAAVRASTRM